jgi:hypothetical protein
MNYVASYNGIDEDDILVCPICKQKAQGCAPQCNHWQAETWDSDFIDLAVDQDEYHSAWYDVRGIIEDLMYDEDVDIEIDALKPTDQSLQETWQGVLEEDDKYWLESCQQILVYNEGTMISGSGVIAYHNDKDFLLKQIAKLKNLAIWIKKETDQRLNK